LAWAVAPALTVASLESSSQSLLWWTWQRRVADLAAVDELGAALPGAGGQSVGLASVKFSAQPLVEQAALSALGARLVREQPVPPVSRRWALRAQVQAILVLQRQERLVQFEVQRAGLVVARVQRQPALAERELRAQPVSGQQARVVQPWAWLV
jgi:hypothetical protein